MIRRSRNLLATLALATVGAAIAASPAGATSPMPAWRVESHAAPAHLVPGLSGGEDMYMIRAVNAGGAPTDGSTVTITDELPTGFTLQPNPTVVLLHALIVNDHHASADCEAGPPVTCHLTGVAADPVVPDEILTAWIPVQAPASGPPVVTNRVTVSGGGAAPASAVEEAPFDSDPPPFAFQHLESSLSDVEGGPVTQAGAHPFSFRIGAGIDMSIHPETGYIQPPENLRNVKVALPPGLVLNPAATPKCAEAQLETNECPADSAVGFFGTSTTVFGFPDAGEPSPIFNVVAPPGTASSFSFNALGLGFFFHVLGGVDAADNYTLEGETKDITQLGGIDAFTFDFWGNTSDPAHDHVRGEVCGYGSSHYALSCPVPADPTPFVSMPSACSGSLSAEATATSWQSGATASTSAETTDAEGNPVGVTGCEALEFQPTLKARPTTNVADSPSGLEVDLHVPQNESQATLATANLKDATVTLPKGVTINPSGGNGLQACSSSQIGLASPIGRTPIRFDEAQPSCPDAARLGTVEVDTPLVEHPLPGAVYIATPYDNPFGSFLAIYIVVDDPATGVLVKLAGEVSADPQTGQLTATFSENPELPVEDFKLDFFGGPGGTLRTPAACGTYVTTSSLVPWSAPESGPPATPEDHWSIEQGPSGACPAKESEQPSSPSFDAGTVSPLAGASSPLVVNLRRADGTQQFSSLTLTPPEGLLGKLAGISYCPEAALKQAEASSGREEEAHPSCPQASYVGSVSVAAGAGPAPYYAPGKAYLTGPYKGAPLSLAIVTPATAGPFDLGTVVVRTALYVNRTTAQITAVSDPIPTILKGIPLDVRSVQVRLDRPEFTLNPTSCDPSSFGGTLMSAFGLATPLQSRFQLGECGRLGFKPKMTLSLKGGIKRGKHPALTATLEPRAGDANLASISVALPHSEFLAQEHIRTVCTRVQFAANECPAESVYGTATVQTPLLSYPLSGPVYLRSSSNTLPDLVPDLKGPASQPIELEADGRTDSVHGGIRNSFEYIPDAPFTKLTLQLQGANKGLLVNSTNICARPQMATVKYTAHNGDTYEAHPVLKAQCPKKRKSSHRAHRRHGG